MADFKVTSFLNGPLLVAKHLSTSIKVSNFQLKGLGRTFYAQNVYGDDDDVFTSHHANISEKNEAIFLTHLFLS